MGCYKCQQTGFHDGQICDCITGKKEAPTVEGAVEMLKRMFGMDKREEGENDKLHD